MNNFLRRTLTSICIVVTLLILFFAPMLYLSLPTLLALPVFLMLTCLYILIVEWPAFCKGWTQWLWLLAPFYIVMPFMFMSLLSLGYGGRIILYRNIAAAFAFDSGAYLVGSRWGKHPIVPSISPHKSWEGFLGGFICVVCTLPLLRALDPFCSNNSISFGSFFPGAYALIFSIAAFLGDLFESWLKRKAGLKDSGTILPGHGGVLDRVDSIIGVIFIMPIMLALSAMYSFFKKIF